MQEDPDTPPVSFHHLLMRPGEDPAEAERRLTVASVSVDEPCPWCGVLIHTMITPWAADNGAPCPSCSGTIVRLGPGRSRASAMGLYIANSGSALFASVVLIVGISAMTVMLMQALQDIVMLGVTKAPDNAIFIFLAWLVCGFLLRHSLLFTGPVFRSIGRLLRGRQFVASIGASIEPSPTPKLLETRRTDETLDGALQIHTDVVGEEHRGGLSQAHEAGGLEIKDP